MQSMIPIDVHGIDMPIVKIQPFTDFGSLETVYRCPRLFCHVVVQAFR